MTTYEYLLDKYGATISFQDAAEELGLYWQTVREMCRRGDIRAIKAGRKWILTTKALAKFLDEGSQRPVITPRHNVRKNRLNFPGGKERRAVFDGI
jgi:excisionase family DNA binding protein